MSHFLARFLALVLLLQTMLIFSISSPCAAKTLQQSQLVTLTNKDIIDLVLRKIDTSVISAKIESSVCAFDTSPGELERLKANGVPSELLVLMINAGLPKASAAEANGSTTNRTVKISAGTPIEIETPYTISSQEVKAGEAISFRVTDPVLVDGVIAIPAGATATGKVLRASRGGHFGRAGRLEWTMLQVRAVDGSRVPLQFSTRQVGDSKGAKVATGIIVTGALLWPIAPIALLHGFKRGENAFIPAGKRFTVIVGVDSVLTIPYTRP